MSGTVASKARTVVPDKAGKQVTGNKQDQAAGKPVKARKSKPAGTKTGTSGRTKSTASKKAVTKKVATGKTTPKKTTPKKASQKKTSLNKAAGKKAPGRKKTSSRTPARSGREPRAGRRAEAFPPGIPAPEADGPVAAAGVKPQTSPDDPKSMSWMAAQAIKALNAVKEHQAEKAQAERLGGKRKTGAPGDQGTGTERVAATAAAETSLEETSRKSKSARKPGSPEKAEETATQSTSRLTSAATFHQAVIPARQAESAGASQSSAIRTEQAPSESVAGPKAGTANGDENTIPADAVVVEPVAASVAARAAPVVPGGNNEPPLGAQNASAAQTSASTADAAVAELDADKVQSLATEAALELTMNSGETTAASADAPDSAREAGVEPLQGPSRKTKPAMAADETPAIPMPRPETRETDGKVPEQAGKTADTVVAPAVRAKSRRRFAWRPAAMAGFVLLGAWLGYHYWFAGDEAGETHSVSDAARRNLAEPGRATELPPSAVSTVPIEPAAVAADTHADPESGVGEGSQAPAASTGMPLNPAPAVQITATPSPEASPVTAAPPEQALPEAATEQPETLAAETAPPPAQTELTGVAGPAAVIPAAPVATPSAPVTQPARSAQKPSRYPAPRYGYYPQQQRWQQPYYRPPYQQAAPR